MSWLKLAVLLLQVVRSIMDYLERQSAIKEGERRQIARELAAVAAAAQIRIEVSGKVKGMTDAQVDDALRGDFRD